MKDQLVKKTSSSSQHALALSNQNIESSKLCAANQERQYVTQFKYLFFPIPIKIFPNQSRMQKRQQQGTTNETRAY